MKPSSRTPEGVPNLCPVCGHKVYITPSRPPGDAPCPRCGHLLWFDAECSPRGRRPARLQSADSYSSLVGSSPPPDRLDGHLDKRPKAVTGKRELTLLDFRSAMRQ